MQVPDYFTGFTQNEVETMLAKFKVELTKVIAQYATNGDSVTRMRRDDLRIEIAGCQRALKKFNPEVYGRRHRVAVSSVATHLPK